MGRAGNSSGDLFLFYCIGTASAHRISHNTQSPFFADYGSSAKACINMFCFPITAWGLGLVTSWTLRRSLFTRTFFLLFFGFFGNSRSRWRLARGGVVLCCTAVAYCITERYGYQFNAVQLSERAEWNLMPLKSWFATCCQESLMSDPFSLTFRRLQESYVRYNLPNIWKGRCYMVMVSQESLFEAFRKQFHASILFSVTVCMQLRHVMFPGAMASFMEGLVV
jgi:hypothetical protein